MKTDGKWLALRILLCHCHYDELFLLPLTVSWGFRESPSLAKMVQREVLTLNEPKVRKINGQDPNAMKASR